MELFEETGAYLRGHFRLTSGLHSGEYLQCAKVLAHPAYAERLGVELARKLQPFAQARSGCGRLAGYRRDSHRPRGRPRSRCTRPVHGTRPRFQRNDASPRL